MPNVYRNDIKYNNLNESKKLNHNMDFDENRKSILNTSFQATSVFTNFESPLRMFIFVIYECHQKRFDEH